jgi:hypothetical protein
MLFFLVAIFSPQAPAISAPFIENFEDGTHSFQPASTQSHEIGGGVSDHTWSVVSVTGGKALRSHTFLRTLDDDSYSVVYASSYCSSPNVAGSDFRFSVDVDISQLDFSKVNDPEVPDESVTIALGVLGSGAFSPTSFAGFKDLNDGQHYYLAVLTIRLGGDEVDPWASDTEGTLHLFEHNGDGQIDSESSKSIKAIGDTFTFSIEGTYNAGALALAAKVESNGDEISADGTDSTPLAGVFFGMRTAAFSRSGINASPDATLDVDFDNVRIDKNYQPDAAIAKGNSNNFKGVGIVNTTGNSQQLKLNVDAGDTANATIRVKNSGSEQDDVSVTGPGSGGGFTVTYFDGATNITGQVTGAGYVLSNLNSGQQKSLKMKVKASGSATGSKQLKINTRSGEDSKARDTVKAKITVQ